MKSKSNHNTTTITTAVPTSVSYTNPETGRISITEAFGEGLAQMLADKILPVYKQFESESFVSSVAREVVGKRYTERIEIIADQLHQYLPAEYREALGILMQILGPENKNETGMFTHYYWLMPVAKFIEKYGLDHFTESIHALEEVTKRNTAEYAIRPYARAFPKKTLAVCKRWARSRNFHLRRLASEGLRPKLPWAPKLTVWNENPTPVFEILELLKADEVMFVKKSVANHLRDWLKVSPRVAHLVVKRWSTSQNKHTLWILKHAQR